MKIRPAAAGAAAAALIVSSAGLAAATSTGAAPPQGPGGRTAALRTQSADVGKQTIRLSGNNRYETSVEVSKDVWSPESTGEVFLATGTGYADALAAGASTLGSGPLLLTTPDALPPVVAAEIKRLQPCYIVVVGGTAAVSDQVALQADALADSSASKCAG